MEARIRDGFPGQRMTVLPPDILHRCRSLPVVRDLFVTDIGHFPSAAHHYVDRSAGTLETIMIYCTDGAGWCELDGQKWVLREGSALFIPPGSGHIYGAHENAPWSICWTHFDGKRAPAYLQMLDVTREDPVLYVPDAQRIVQAFEEMYSYLYHAYTDASLMGLSTTLTHLLGLLKCRQRAPHATKRHREDKILHSIQYMREHLDEPRVLSDLAAAAQMSVSHYSHVFKEQTNTSPVNFFIRLKMQRACELLDTTDRAVSAIARRVGYEDPFHFCRMFKNVIGKSPTHYRNTIKG